VIWKRAAAERFFAPSGSVLAAVRDVRRRVQNPANRESTANLLEKSAALRENRLENICGFSNLGTDSLNSLRDGTGNHFDATGN